MQTPLIFRKKSVIEIYWILFQISLSIGLEVLSADNRILSELETN